MKILAFDSTAKAASVALSENGRLLGLYTIDNGLTQSELLLPMAEDLLKSLKLDFSDVDLYCASVGPGSFTGVRIGVSLVKGLAFGKDTPCVEVSTLEALAENLAGLRGYIVPCMDARRGQVYTAIFSSDGMGLTRVMEDTAISIDELAERLGKLDGPIYLSGDGYEVARSGRISAGVAVENTPTLLLCENAFSCAKVAERKYAAGKAVSDIDFAPTYLRMPQAERERLERERCQK